MIPTHTALCTFAADAHRNAVSKGFYDPPPRWSRLLMLIQGEFHEAHAELRDGRAPTAIRCPSGPVVIGNDGDAVVMVHDGYGDETYDPSKHGKLSGYLVELADVVIRALDALAYADKLPLLRAAPSAADFAAYAKLSAEEFCETALDLSQDSGPRDLSDVVYQCFEWAHAHELPLWHVAQAKHAYNRTRPHKHGKVF